MDENYLVSKASYLLERQHLAPAAGLATWPVNGRVFGVGRRPLACLPCSYRGKQHINIIFIVDTGAPVTKVSPHAFQAMGLRGDVLGPVTININGTEVDVQLCELNSHYADIPILGADAMQAMALKLFIDYPNGSVMLTPRVGMHCCDCHCCCHALADSMPIII